MANSDTARLCFRLTAAAVMWSWASTAGAQQPQSKAISITLAGQSMIRSDIRATAPAAVASITSLLRGDVIFTNLEGTIGEKGESATEGRGFLAPPEALDALKSFGFNLLALSDNHAFDLKAVGIQNTIREANDRKLIHAGTGNNVSEAAMPGYLHTSGATIALISSASGLIAPDARATAEHAGVNELRIQSGDKENEATADFPSGASANTPNPEDAQRILQSIRLAHQHSDLVIVYQHNHVFGNYSFSTIFNEGMQERLRPNEWLVRWTHAEIDAGADIIVMHGAPLLHGVEIYKGKPIFYDLGNFIYNVPPTLTYISEPMAWESMVASVQFQGRKLQSISLRPVVLNYLGQGQPDVQNGRTNNEFLATRGLPSPATGAKAGYILQRVADASKPFGTVIVVKGDTADIDLKSEE